jgi:primosomal protein N' (replication factor Y)
MATQQQNLFDTDPAPWELDDQIERLAASVVVSEGVDGVFDYWVPDRLRASVQPGKRLEVPFGRGDRKVIGYCVELVNRPSTKQLKEVRSVVDEYILLTPHMLRLTRWMSDYYLAPWAKVLETVLPAAVRDQAGTRAKTFLQVPPDVAANLDQYELSPKQADALRRLAAAPDAMTPEELAESLGCTLSPINALRKRGLVEELSRRVRNTVIVPLTRESHVEFQMNQDQQAALNAVLSSLENQRAETILLHGVTGSGKTEVYIRAIERVIQFGRQAIVLVPEISLTPQTQRRFRSRFEHVALLHSHLSDAERNFHWQQIAAGRVQVVVGARSAVFAPTPHLGLIIIDEEHDGSFKQDNVPRYHARDVARERSAYERIPVLLGSATPSLESWHRAVTGAYRLVSMPRRVSKLPLPVVHTIDMREESKRQFPGGAIGRQLGDAVISAVSAGGQVILLLNRRGYSTHIQCPACGKTVKCEDCDIALTHHREGDKAMCHYCDFETTAPLNCPSCGFEGIRYTGIGTQKLEAEVRSRFPKFECLRVDSDTMRKPGSHEKAFARFRSGEIKILLGTQMIAKGLDFPNVTLVGVINADTGLHLPDFRAAERVFQLVTQVAGRTGRSERGGRVLVQSYEPENAAIQAAQRHDFLGFAAQELPNRQQFAYPPYGSLARVVVKGRLEPVTEAFAGQIAEHVRVHTPRELPGFRLLGPAVAPIAKLRGEFRFHMIIQALELEPIRQCLRSARTQLKPPEDVQWIADIDPVDMM